MKKTLLLLLMLLSFAALTLGADRVITGTVNDNSGNPLPGTSVKVEGTKIITLTDGKGWYSINVPNGKNKLQFSFLGYISQTVSIKNNVINVTLQPQNQSLDEVVVVGY